MTRILFADPVVLDELESEVFITTNIDNYDFSVPFTIYFNGIEVIVYEISQEKTRIRKKTDIIIDKYRIRILLSNEIGIAENYLQPNPDLVVCFEKTNVPAKFFYRKAQMWVGAQISKKKVMGVIVYNGITNRVLFEENQGNGILFDGTSYIVLDNKE